MSSLTSVRVKVIYELAVSNYALDSKLMSRIGLEPAGFRLCLSHLHPQLLGRSLTRTDVTTLHAATQVATMAVHSP